MPNLRQWSACTLCVLLASSAACSKEVRSLTIIEASLQPVEIDFVELLHRGDPVVACARYMEKVSHNSYGEGFIPYEHTLASCECLHDTMIHSLAPLTIGRPELENAILQLSLNLELQESMFNPEVGEPLIGAFEAFVTEQGPEKLGFAAEELIEVLEQAGDAAIIWETATIEDVRKLEGCVRLEKANLLIEGYDPETGVEGLEEILADQRNHYAANTCQAVIDLSWLGLVRFSLRTFDGFVTSNDRGA